MNLLDEKCPNVDIVSKVLQALPRRFDAFPSLAELEETIKEFAPTIQPLRKAIEPWISRRSPGTPPLIEAICEHLLANTAEMPHVKRMIEHTRFTTEEIWAIYEEWFAGRIHEKARDFKSPSPFEVFTRLGSARESAAPALSTTDWE